MRPKGTRQWLNETSVDQQAVSLSTYSGITEGCLYSLSFSWTGQTAGDRVAIHDGSSIAGTKLFDFIVPTAAGSFSPVLPSVGLAFGTGLYLNPNLSDGAAGKFKVCIGWDVRN